MVSDEVQRLHDELVSALREALGGKSSFAEALDLDADKIVGLALFARELAEQGQLEDARTIFEGLVVCDPNNAYLRTSVASVYMQLGYVQAARDEFSNALQLDSTDIAAHTNIGELYMEEGDLENAALHFQKAVELDPDQENPFANRARTLALMVATIAKEVEAKGPQALEELRQRVADFEGADPS